MTRADAELGDEPDRECTFTCAAVIIEERVDELGTAWREHFGNGTEGPPKTVPSCETRRVSCWSAQAAARKPHEDSETLADRYLPPNADVKSKRLILTGLRVPGSYTDPYNQC